ncbi:hypothetical protein DMC64_20420 [Amycolatopsis sp. WAC 04197]|nr:hypothetical protein DMC64_20420 [Amycolatopsis sp. WAC 04197]
MGRAEIFPEGQICAHSEQGLLASLSVNRIHWDGRAETLPTWDQVAGDPSTCERTFSADGNTLCLLSMNVRKEVRGRRLSGTLVRSLLNHARQVGAEHVIGSFRPSAYGEAVLSAVERGCAPPEFADYCFGRDSAGTLIDPWLRTISKMGMKPVVVDHEAMSRHVTAKEFEDLRRDSWRAIDLAGRTAWWCNETGFFYQQEGGMFRYVESNLWGTLAV